MEFLVVLDKDSAIGAWMLTVRGKIGGATGVMDIAANVVHPYVIASALDWTKLPAFVGLTHLQNPGADDPRPKELVVPAAVVLAVTPWEKPASQPPDVQQLQPSPLH